jgi:hypothetical protein
MTYEPISTWLLRGGGICRATPNEEVPWFSVCLNMEHTSCQEVLQWYYEHDQLRVKEMKKKYEEYERTFWDVVKKLERVEGGEQDALRKLLDDFKFEVAPVSLHLSCSFIHLTRCV